MPTLPEIIAQLQLITNETALFGLFVTAGAILLTKDWRILIMALLAQYVLVGIMLLSLVRPDIAVLKVLIGAFICPILFLSARQISVRTATSMVVGLRAFGPGRWRQLPGRIGSFAGQYSSTPTGLVFRTFVGLIMILVTLTLSSSFPLPGLATSVTTAVYWLVVAGLVTLIITEDPLKAGTGLFTVLIGFDLFYATLESSLLLTGMWGSVNLLIALAVGYLTVVKGTGLEEEH